MQKVLGVLAAGLAAVAASRRNIQFMMRQLAIQTISYDKISQLMHVRFFGDYRRMKEHMKLHAAILRPKFQLVQDIFREELEGLGVAGWTEPRGGYFISFQTLPHCAKRTVALCKNAGVISATHFPATFSLNIRKKVRRISLVKS